MEIVAQDDVGRPGGVNDVQACLRDDPTQDGPSHDSRGRDTDRGPSSRSGHGSILDDGTAKGRDRTAPFASDAVQRCERALFFCVVAVRSVHLVQAGVTLFTGWGSYRRPILDSGLLLAALIESVVVLSMFWRRREVRGVLPAIIDVSFGAAALLAMVVVTSQTDRSAWINWACPYTYGSLAIAVLVFRRQIAGLIMVGFVSLYLATAWSSLMAGGSLLSTSLANAVSYVGLFAAASVFFGALRRSACDVDAARADAVSRGARLATERERNAQHRLLHDSALQTIEIIARSDSIDDAVRTQARREAARLRLALRGDPVGAGAGLLLDLEQLAVDFAEQGLRVEVHDRGLTGELDPSRARALCDATREGLANVVKHAGVAKAVVSARCVAGNMEVTIRDHGCGFVLSATTAGFGLRESIAGRLADMGGTVEVWTAPGRGVRLTLMVAA